MIVSAINNNKLYQKQLLAFLASLQKNAPSERVRVFLVNCDASYKAKVKRANSNVQVVHRKLKFGTSSKAIRGKMVCFRASALLSTLKSCKEPVAWFDTDILVRHSLAEFWQDVHAKAIKIMYRPEGNDRTHFQAGVFALGNSPEIVAMVRAWKRKIEALNRWYADQQWLYKITKAHDKVQHIDLPQRFNDWTFQPDSTIWHSKGAYFEDETFQREYQLYLPKSAKS